MSSSKHKQQRRHEREKSEYATQQDEKRKTRNVALAGIAAVVATGGIAAALVLSGGSGGGGGGSSAAAAVKVDTAGLSPQLAANAKDANRLVDGDISKKLDELEGVPVVVNQWASWCPGCLAEFGYFAQLAETYREKVAFVGLDSQDSRDDGEQFLEENPVSFPSIFDESASQAASIGAGQGWPTTVFYNAKGDRTFIKPGAYTTVESLDSDIRQYALQGS